MEQLAPGIYVETGFTGVTVGAIVGKEGIICIDTPTLPADARKWRLKLAQLSDAPIQYIINLDHHFDRVLGNQWFEAPVIASEAAAEQIRAYPDSFKSQGPETGADSDLADDLAGVRIVPPQLTFNNNLTLFRDSREIHLRCFPGPTPGATWVHLPQEQIVFAGDSVIIDMPPLLVEANTEKWLASLNALKKPPFRNHYIVPGRGEVADASELHWLSKFIRTARRKVTRLYNRDQEGSATASLIPEFLDYWEVPVAEQPHMSARLQAGLEHLWNDVERAQVQED